MGAARRAAAYTAGTGFRAARTSSESTRSRCGAQASPMWASAATRRVGECAASSSVHVARAAAAVRLGAREARRRVSERANARVSSVVRGGRRAWDSGVSSGGGGLGVSRDGRAVVCTARICVRTCGCEVLALQPDRAAAEALAATLRRSMSKKNFGRRSENCPIASFLLSSLPHAVWARAALVQRAHARNTAH